MWGRLLVAAGAFALVIPTGYAVDRIVPASSMTTVTTSVATAAPTLTARSATSPTVTPQCATSSLEVWLGLGPGGGAAGSTYYPLEFTNIGKSTCTLSGVPAVLAFGSKQLGSAASWDHSTPVQFVSLAAGETTHAWLRITNVDNYVAAKCKPVTATALKVYPPGQSTASFVTYSFRACSLAGPVYLSVQPAHTGVGIPGHP